MDKNNCIVLENNWEIFEENGEYYLLIQPLFGSAFLAKQKLTISKEIYDYIFNSDRSLDAVFKAPYILDVFRFGAMRTGKATINTDKTFFIPNGMIENVDGEYYFNFRIPFQGGGSVKVLISKEDYVKVRSGEMSHDELKSKYFN